MMGLNYQAVAQSLLFQGYSISLHILPYDEPSSALDPISEYQLNQSTV